MQRIRAATACIALVTDDDSIADHLLATVADEMTSLAVHLSFEDLMASVSAAVPDVVVFDDISEPDAASQIRQLRRRMPSLHIVYVRARDEARTIALLHCGADDAMTESSPTMIARLQAAARRARTVNAGARIAVGDIVFDRESRRVWCAGREVALTPHEYDVVDCLFWHAPTPVGVDTLADFVWGDEVSTNRRALVQVYISYVRKKLAASVKVAIGFSRKSGYGFSPRPENGKK